MNTVAKRGAKLPHAAGKPRKSAEAVERKKAPAPGAAKVAEAAAGAVDSAPVGVQESLDFSRRRGPGEVEWARNYQQLAQVLGYTARQLRAIKRENPGCPKPRANGHHNVGLWREYLADLGLGKDWQASGESGSLKDERLRVQIEREKFNLDKERGLWIKRDLVEARMAELVPRLFKDLRRVLVSTTPPLYQGKDTSECSAINAEALDRLQADFAERAKGVGR